MTKYKVAVNDDCILCSTCTNICPENFKLNDKKAEPINEVIDEVGNNEEAKEMCPVGAISVQKVEE